jgi:hypothetical protein
MLAQYDSILDGLLALSTDPRNPPSGINPFPNLNMTFEEFQNRARLYAIGALYSNEVEEFEKAATVFGAKAEAFIRDCFALRDAFALSLRRPASRDALKTRITSLVRRHERI